MGIGRIMAHTWDASTVLISCPGKQSIKVYICIGHTVHMLILF